MMRRRSRWTCGGFILRTAGHEVRIKIAPSLFARLAHLFFQRSIRPCFQAGSLSGGNFESLPQNVLG